MAAFQRLAMMRLSATTLRSVKLAPSDLTNLRNTRALSSGAGSTSPALDLTFCDERAACCSKSSGDLMRSLLVLRLCSSDALVRNHDKLLRSCRRLLGRRLFVWMMKQTFYGHFVAGEDHVKIRPLVEKNLAFGVKSILDYSAEKDVSEEREERPQATRTLERDGASEKKYVHQDEYQCDENLNIFLRSIDAVAESTKGTGFAAVKLTALGRPQFLLHLSESLLKSPLAPGEQSLLALAGEESDQMRHMMERLNQLAEYACSRDVRVMIDAEQSYLQPAISSLTLDLMRRYNTSKPIIFNTYQCYLKAAMKGITADLELSKKEGFYFGCKLVRGAYMDQERSRAKEMGYESPINPDYDSTSSMYHSVLDYVLQELNDRPRGDVIVMIASHNEETVKYGVEKMKEAGILPKDEIVCFGQLLGMCDQVSFPLGQAGYSVYKYVPYGPVEEVLPYLSRRALENNGLLQKVEKERSLIKNELWRRITGQ